MKQDQSPAQPISSEENHDAASQPASWRLPVGVVVAVITVVVGILGEVLIGFALAQKHDLSMLYSPDATTLTSLTRTPIVGLGIAWLVSILAHAVGLFLQQEDFSQIGRTAENNDDESPGSPALYPGYILAMIAFALSALAGVACILAAGVLLLALLAYYRDLWKKPILGPVVLSGAKAMAILLGAAAGGWRGQILLMPELFLACVALAVYTWACEATAHELPRRGLARWRVTVASGVVGLALAIAAFRAMGLSTGPWLVVLLAIWLTARSSTLNLAMNKPAGPYMEQALTRQFQRGELLLLAGIIAALLPDWQGTLAFAAVFILFPIAAFLDRR